MIESLLHSHNKPRSPLRHLHFILLLLVESLVSTPLPPPRTGRHDSTGVRNETCGSTRRRCCRCCCATGCIARLSRGRGSVG